VEPVVVGEHVAVRLRCGLPALLCADAVQVLVAVVLRASVVIDELMSGEHRARYLLATLQFHDLAFSFTLQAFAVFAARIRA
jgi:hypothetical protein